MMAPLIPLALLYGEAKKRVKDPKITLRLGTHAKRIGVMKLVGTIIFASFGVLFIVLALTGNSENAPAFQKAMGSWMRSFAAYVDGVPNFVSLPILAALVGAFVYAIFRRGGDISERKEGKTGASGAASVGAAREVDVA